MKKFVSTQDKNKVKKSYDNFANSYLRHYKSPTSLFGLEKGIRAAYVKESIGRSNQGRILDIGCGPGYVAFNVANEFNKSEVYAMDFSSEMIRFAQKNFCPSIKLVQGDIEEIPLESESMDFVYALGVLEKFRSPHRVMKDVNRVLKPGGEFLFSYPNITSLTRRVRNFVRRTRKQLDNLELCSLLSENSIVDTLNELGFCLMEKSYITYGNSLILFPWSSYQNKMFEKMFRRNLIGQVLAFTCIWKSRKKGRAN